MADLDRAFSDALEQLPEWRLRPAYGDLVQLGARLPALVGKLDVATLRALISGYASNDPKLGIAAVAELIGKTEERVRQLCRDGVLGRYDRASRRWLVRRSQAIHFMETRTLGRPGRRRKKIDHSFSCPK